MLMEFKLHTSDPHDTVHVAVGSTGAAALPLVHMLDVFRSTAQRLPNQVALAVKRPSQVSQQST
jgi:hypothetical protein